jgi:hypothetical protein
MAIKEEIENARSGYIELPVDSNGKPLHVGDFIEYNDGKGTIWFMQIHAIAYEPGGCAVYREYGMSGACPIKSEVLEKSTLIERPTLKRVIKQVRHEAKRGNLTGHMFLAEYLPAIEAIAAFYEGEE